MPKKKYIVALTVEERETLEQLIKTGKKTTAKKINHARILLKADCNQADGGWRDATISEALDISVSTIERVRQQMVESGLERALNPAPRPPSTLRRLDGEQEARLIALACGTPPLGQKRWSLRLLADRMVMLRYVEYVSHETVRQVLKKTNYDHI